MRGEEEIPVERRRQMEGFALLGEVGLLINADRVDEAVAAARRLERLFADHEESGDLHGFGEMLLDAGDWLLGCGRAETALEIAVRVEERLAVVGPGRAPADGRRAVVAARAVYAVAVALGRLGRLAEATVAITAFRSLGDLALQALDQAAHRVQRDGGDPITIGQIAVNQILVLRGLGQIDDARALTDAVGRAYGDDPSPAMQALLAELAAGPEG